MSYPKRVLESSREFLAALDTKTDWGKPYEHHEWQYAAQHMAASAYFLYQRAWSSPLDSFDIREWVWPVNTVLEGNRFTGLEPWAVLFRECIRLVRQHAEKS